MKHTRRPKAFSLIELMVAIFIIASCLLLVIGVFVFLFSSMQKGIDITTGVATSHMIMSKWIYEHYGSLNAGLVDSKYEIVNKVTYTYNIEVKACDADPKLMLVAMKVYWWDRYSRDAHGAGEFFATGYGNFSTDISRYVYKGEN